MNEPTRELVEAARKYRRCWDGANAEETATAEGRLDTALAAAEKWLEGVEAVDGLTGCCNAPAIGPAGQQYQFCPRCGRPVRKTEVTDGPQIPPICPLKGVVNG